MSDSPAEIERQLEHDRTQIGATLDAIEARLSPRRLIGQGLGYVRSGGGEAAETLAQSARQNPWPLVLTGIGLGWLMATSRSPAYGDPHDTQEFVRRRDAAERARAAEMSLKQEEGEDESRFQERVNEAMGRALSLTRGAEESAEAFRNRVQESLARAEKEAENLRHRAASAWNRGTEATGRTAEAMQARAQDVRSRGSDFYESQPLVAGVVGVLAGTLLGALLPPTRTEDQWFGEYGRQARERAGEAGSTAARRAVAAAEEGAQAATEKALGDGEDRSSTAAGPR